MLNLKRPMDVPNEYTQTRAYIINKGGMNLERSNDIPMEINMSKWVGEHFIYLCIPEFYLPTTCGWTFEVAAIVAWLHMVKLR